MSERIILVGDSQRQHAMQCIRNAGHNYVVTISEPTRSIIQNSKLWAMLTDVSKQVVWYECKLSCEDWKDIFTNALKKELRTSVGLDGRPVIHAYPTSKMKVQDFSDLIELIYEFGARHDVQWSEKTISFMEMDNA